MRIYRLVAAIVLIATPAVGAEQPSTVSNVYISEQLTSDRLQLAQARIDLLNKAVQRGDLDAMVELGEYYAEGSFDHENQLKAFKLFAKAAEQEHPAGQYNLAMQYYWGLGVPRDPDLAYLWYQRAADQGHPKAQHNLAHMYLRGVDVRRDVPEAAKWFGRAADQGVAESKSGLGVILGSGEAGVADDQRAFSLYRESAGQGDSVGQHNLAVMYYKGAGVRQHLGYAYFWAVLAARQGRYESIRLARVIENEIPAGNSMRIRKQAIAWEKSDRMALSGDDLNRWFATIDTE